MPTKYGLRAHNHLIMTKDQEFFTNGWCTFDLDPELHQWVQQALPVARKVIHSEQHAHWLRHDGTWHAGVNILPNTPHGNIANSAALGGEAVDFIHEHLSLGEFDWDRAQVSVCYPGYPKASADESESAFGYRRKRDAAHIDGLLRAGAERRRYLREYHGFILGIPLVEFSEGASPFVVWQGSHHLARQMFTAILEDHPSSDWSNLDLTDPYHQLRKQIFDQCKRITISMKPGQAFLVHRLALHGMAPWQSAATAGPDGRMICYFRPQTGSAEDWLFKP